MLYYFAVFIPATEGGYVIRFPDFPEALTQGDTMAEGMEMGADALNITVEEYAKVRKPLPSPSGMDAVQAWMERELIEDSAGVDMKRPAHFQLFAAPEVDMTPVKVSVSIAKSALDRIDRNARRLGLTRSGFITKATETYLA
jgi:predicted RNase H-like HicB family nuclease